MPGGRGVGLCRSGGGRKNGNCKGSNRNGLYGYGGNLRRGKNHTFSFLDELIDEYINLIFRSNINSSCRLIKNKCPIRDGVCNIKGEGKNLMEKKVMQGLSGKRLRAAGQLVIENLNWVLLAFLILFG